MYFLDHPQRPTTRTKQKRELQNQPGMQQYLQEKEAVDANTARLRALRLAKQAEDAEAAPAPKRAAPKKKPATRRGTGSH